MDLADRTCEPCSGKTPALDTSERAKLLQELNQNSGSVSDRSGGVSPPGSDRAVSSWTISADGHLQRSIKTKDFAASLALANNIGAIAEEMQHHPDLLVRWGELHIDIWTHAINGLSESDFVLAAKIDRAAP